MGLKCSVLKNDVNDSNVVVFLETQLMRREVVGTLAQATCKSLWDDTSSPGANAYT